MRKTTIYVRLVRIRRCGAIWLSYSMARLSIQLCAIYSSTMRLRSLNGIGNWLRDILLLFVERSYWSITEWLNMRRDWSLLTCGVCLCGICACVCVWCMCDKFSSITGKCDRILSLLCKALWGKRTHWAQYEQIHMSHCISRCSAVSAVLRCLQNSSLVRSLSSFSGYSDHIIHDMVIMMK